MPHVIGWAASVVLIATLCRQIHSQWKSRRAGGVSVWLYVGQTMASTLFVVYSALMHSWVFLVTNALGILGGVAGYFVHRRNQRLSRA